MAKSRLTPEQIRLLLLEIVAGRTVKDVSIRYGVSTTTLYRWRAKFAEKGQPVKDRLCSLEVENRRLKSQVAELSLDYQTLRAALVADAKSEC
ncbi:MAG: hypothetical protein OJF52_001979 [Nitrospira sp.]|jgi:putative transposase|nr:MAG: hypothetical protein OJF52_001979 [Nitrospira sp.]